LTSYAPIGLGLPVARLIDGLVKKSAFSFFILTQVIENKLKK